MKILVELTCPKDWREDHFLVVKGTLEDHYLLDVVSVVALE